MIDTLILLQDEPQLIYDRMFKRDGHNKVDLRLLTMMQEQETLYAEELKSRGIEVCYITPMSDEISYMKYFTEGRKH